MNTFWLKIAGGVLVLFIVLIVGASFLSSDKPAARPAPEPEVSQEPKSKTIYDMAEEDKQKYSVPAETSPPAESPVANTPVTEPEPTPPMQAEPSPAPTPPPPSVIYVKPLGEIDRIQAEKLLNFSTPAKTMGRMRIGYKLMTDNCKRIIKDYPDSVFAFRAKQMLADMPERYRTNYKITDAHMDISKFYIPRRGTKPMQLPHDH